MMSPNEEELYKFMQQRVRALEHENEYLSSRLEALLRLKRDEVRKLPPDWSKP